MKQLSTVTSAQIPLAPDQSILDDEEPEPVDDDMDAPSTPSEHQEDPPPKNHALEEVHEMLVDALSSGDLVKVTHVWPRLRSMQPLSPGLVPLAYWRQYSQLISELDLWQIPPDSDILRTLDELSAHVSSNPIPAAYFLMRYYLLKRNPDAALYLIHMVQAVQEKRNSDILQLLRTTSGEEYRRLVAVSGESHRTQLYEHTTCAIAACMMKGTFFPLLGLGIRKQLAFGSLHDMMSHLHPLIEEVGLSMEQARRWTRRFHDLHVASRPLPTFSKFIAQFATSVRREKIAHFCESMLDELSREDSCLTLDPAVAAASEHPIVLFTEEKWALFIQTLMRVGKVKSAEHFWVGTGQLGVRTPTLVWAAVIEGFAALKMFGRVRTAWNAFSSTSAAPVGLAAPIYRAYVSALFDEGREEGALAIFESFHKQLHKESESGLIEGVAVVSVYNAVLEWLVRQSRVPEAREILDRMKTSGPKPDTGSFNVFIQHASRAKDLKTIADIIREMKSMNMTGDLYTASILLTVLYPVRADSTELIITLLRDSGTVLDIAAYNTLLNHLVRLPSDDAIAAAVRLLDYMEAQPSPTTRPDGLSYTGVLCGIERRVWKDPSLAARFRWVVIGTMKDQGRKLTRSAATRNVIEACFEHPGPEGVRQAMIYYDRYRKIRLQLGWQFEIGIWCALLDHLARRKEWKLADSVANEILVSQQQIPKALETFLHRVQHRISEPDFYDTV